MGAGNNMRGAIYKVNESSIFVRNRPKSLEIGSNKNTWNNEDADAFLSVTDTFVTPPEGKIFVWFPWNEGRSPIPEMYYATNKVLNWWVFYQKVKNIQIFCDGGTHRSVTVFGAFLRTYFDKVSAQEIVNKHINIGIEDSTWSSPLDYIDSYLEKFPEDNLLFKAMGEDRLSRLENYSKVICDKVKGRYGDNS